jgi:hypothetical protein
MKTISTLGKILFIFLLSYNLYANAVASLSTKSFYEGDSVKLIIEAQGNKIEFPNLTEIEGFPVIGTGSSSQTSIINGNVTKYQTLRYTFYPTKSIDIKPIEVKIDGKIYKTGSLHLNKIKPTASKKGDLFELNLKTSKKKAYVGEPIILTLQFKYKNGANIIDANLADFEMNNFWVKKLNSPKPYQKGDYVVYDSNYLIFAQKSGELTIPNQKIDIATRTRNFLTSWKKVFSNNAKLDITPLPNGTNILGDYKINASVDKTVVNANKPTNLTITLEGFGNIDDVDPFNLELVNEVVYSSKPEVKSFIKKNKYGGKFVQKISIVGDKDFTIPAIKFSYFDIKTKTIKTIETKPFKIEVKGQVKKETPKIETNGTTIETQKVIVKTVDSNIKYLYGLVGLILGGAIVYLLLTRNIKKEKVEKPISKKIKQAKSDKELYDILLPYSQNKDITTYIKILEENIYNQGEIKIDKKELIEIFEESLV